MKNLLFFIILIIPNLVYAELLKPSPSLTPEEVILIQLKALKDNNRPYQNAGIEQTWEFAHPLNRKFTGPLDKFISMMYNQSYSMILDHNEHNLIFITKNEFQSFFFVELIDNNGIKLGFQWVVEKVLDEGKYKNCWMTSSVSQPMILSKSA